MDKLDYLINYLVQERKESIVIPTSLIDKKNLYKALVNIREPNPIDDEYIANENAYLQEELKDKGIITIEDLELFSNSKIKNKNLIYLWQGDITRLKIDAIVNPANSGGLGCFNPAHKCLDNIINVSSGIQLRLECNDIMSKKNYHLNTSEVMITKGYNLPSKHVIHTVGPIIDGEVTKEDEDALSKCYINCLEIAKYYNIRSIAFPCISTGIFSYPKKEASLMAIQTVDDYLDKNKEYFDYIVFCVYTDEDYNYYVNY